VSSVVPANRVDAGVWVWVLIFEGGGGGGGGEAGQGRIFFAGWGCFIKKK